MPDFSAHKSSTRTKVLVLGDSGSGKTSLAATLANAGYPVFIEDWDGKLDILHEYLSPESYGKVQYITVKEDAVGEARAWKRGKDLIWKSWVDPETGEDFGKIKDWDPSAVLFLDSLTFMGEAAKHYAASINGKPVHAALTPQEWGEARRHVDHTLDYIMSDNVPCNVVATAIPIPIDDETGVSRIYPQCVTKNYAMTVGGHFTNLVGLKSRRDGSRYFRTISDSRTEYKNIRPSVVPKEMDADLAEFFRLVQGAE